MPTPEHKQCSSCFFSTEFPGISIEENGRCNVCNSVSSQAQREAPPAPRLPAEEPPREPGTRPDPSLVLLGNPNRPLRHRAGRFDCTDPDLWHAQRHAKRPRGEPR